MKRKWSIYIFITGLCLLMVGCNKQEKVEYEIESQIKERDFYIQTIPSKTDESYCIISRSSEVPLVVPEKYVIDHYMELEGKYMTKGGYGDDNTVTKLVAYVQDIYTLEVVKEIDVNLLLEPYMEEYQVVGYTMELREENEKYYLERRVWERYSEEELRERTIHSETEIKELWIDIETEETQLREWAEIDGEEHANIWLLVKTLILDYAIDRRVYAFNSEYIKDTTDVKVPIDVLPENNKKLYTMFPNLKNVKKEEDIYAHFFLRPRPDNMEVLSILLEDDEDVDFSVLPSNEYGNYGTYQSGGIRYDIITEKYEQFQKEYWEYRKKQREEYGIPQPEEKTDKKENNHVEISSKQG